jgi:hypothetical protein
MQSQLGNRVIRQIELYRKSASFPDEPAYTGGENLEKLFEKVALQDVPLEDRRREASKPLYLMRYE